MPTRRNILIMLPPAVVAMTALGYRAIAAKPQSAVNTLDSPSGAAIKGYDPVAYFTDSKPVQGKAEYATTHAGTKWLFASQENKSRFEASPDTYLPAYGGYCAYGVAGGYLVKIEPEAFTIRNGRLYLNYDVSVKKKWDRDPAGFIATADRKWPRLIASK